MDLTVEDTVEHILEISPDRMNKISWAIEDICATHTRKAEAIVAISKLEATDSEKVFMGYLLCQYYILHNFPRYISSQVLGRI